MTDAVVVDINQFSRTTGSIFLGEDRLQQRVVLKAFDGRNGAEEGANRAVVLQLKITGLESFPYPS
jgi:hypothetical protein